MPVLAATAAGLAVIDPEAGSETRELEGHTVSRLAPAGWKRLWAVVDGREIWSSDGDGWRPVVTMGDAEPTCLADTRANVEDGILVGTAGARLARVSAAGQIEPLSSFDCSPGRGDWFTPWGGPPAIRTVSEDRDTVYVNVHVGGVLRSRDAGASWEPTIDIHADIHQVTTAGGRVYAAGAAGLSISEDRGDTWRTVDEGLHSRYCRAIAVCGDQVLLTASEGPGAGRAAVYRSSLDAVRFERCQAGLPDWFTGNVDSLCLDALPGGELAAFGTEGGDLYTSGDRGVTWEPIATGLGSIWRVLVLPKV